METRLEGMRKAVITFGIIAVVLLSLFTIGPIAYSLLTGTGLKTASLVEGGEPAETEVDGTWRVVQGHGTNSSQVGYTFFEVLPGESKTTSGRADNMSEENITGTVQVTDGVMTSGFVEVRVDGIRSDVERRDINVRRSILHTDQFPTASFSLLEPVNVAHIPGDGSASNITVHGELELHGSTKALYADFRVLRTGKHVVLSAEIPISRADFGIETPEFVAAKIDDAGTVDVLLVLSK